MKPEFEDSVLTHQEVEAGKLGWTDFDYDAVDAALGNEPAEEEPTNAAQAADKLREILHFICHHAPHRETAIEEYGRRAMVTLWILNPSAFDGISLQVLAKLTGVPKRNLSIIASEFTATFGLSSHGQSHGEHGRKVKPPTDVSGVKLTRAFHEAVVRANREIAKEDNDAETLKAHRVAPSVNDVDPSMN